MWMLTSPNSKQDSLFIPDFQEIFTPSSDQKQHPLSVALCFYQSFESSEIFKISKLGLMSRSP